ncbi:MAG: hypothetical protein HOP11_00595 [Saprospiraceae bacterium]|nr:hypothetical protein [Saprospiraceae bacterium]
MKDILRQKTSVNISMTGEKVDPKTPENKVGHYLKFLFYEKVYFYKFNFG